MALPKDAVKVNQLPEDVVRVDQNQPSGGFPITPQGMIGLGAAGLGVGLAGKFVAQPFIDYAGVSKQINQLKKEQGINPKVQSKDIAGQINTRAKDARLMKTQQIADARLASDQSILDAKNQLKQFDNVIIQTSADNAAQLIKENIDGFRKGAYEGYGAGRRAASDLIEGSMAKPSGQYFNSKVLDPILESPNAKWMSDGELKILNTLKKKISPFKSVTINQIDDFINGVYGVNPKLAYSLSENFGQMLEDLSPEGSMAKLELKKINKTYKPFGEMNKATYRTINPKTGVFDDTALTKMLSGYVKTAQDTSVDNILKLLSEGNDNIPAINGLKKEVDKLGGLRSDRIKLVDRLNDVIKQKPQILNQLNTELRDEVSKFSQLSAKAKELDSIRGSAIKGMKGRALVGAVLLGKGLVKEFLGLPFTGKVATLLPGVQVALMAPTAFDLWQKRREPLKQYATAMDAATLGLSKMGNMPTQEKIREISQSINQNPDYSNAIMTPETLNFLRWRNKEIEKVKGIAEWARTKDEKQIAKLKKAKL